MTLLRWPIHTLAPREVFWGLDGNVLAGPPSITGLAQIANTAGGGYWTCRLADIPVGPARAIRKARALEALLDGGATPIVVPMRDGARAANGVVSWSASIPHSDGPAVRLSGVTASDLYAGVDDAWNDAGVLDLVSPFGALVSVTEAEALAGASAIAVTNADGEDEILIFQNAALLSGSTYRVSRLIRGLFDTESAWRNPVSAGAAWREVNVAFSDEFGQGGWSEIDTTTTGTTFFSDDTGYEDSGGANGTAVAAADLRATTLTIAMEDGAELEGGEHFSISHTSAGRRLYRVGRVERDAISFRPPLREAIAAGCALDFAQPSCLMRLADPRSLQLPLELNRLGRISPVFVEHDVR